MNAPMFYLLCYLITAVRNAQSLSPLLVFANPSPSHDECKRTSSAAFVETTIALVHVEACLERSRIRVGTMSLAECHSEATTRGAQAYMHYDDCYLFLLRYPICRKWTGGHKVYVRKDYYTDGSSCDNATLLPVTLKNFGANARSFRIESPTILSFEDYYATEGLAYMISNVIQVYTMIILTDGQYAYSDRSILADPSCYTQSTCGHVFVTSAPPIAADELLVLYNICSKSTQVDSGKSRYIFSHEGVGCKYFPNDYPAADCWAEFSSAGEIKINVTFVNFRESNQCDGFTMAALTYDESGSSYRSDLCMATAPTELTSQGGKLRIEFGRRALPARQKYGFIIVVSSE